MPQEISATISGSGEILVGGDGVGRMRCLAHAALTALTPYKMFWNEFGPVSAAIADDTTTYRIIIPEAAVASGVIFEGVVSGPIDDVVTPSLAIAVGNALSITNGVITDDGADYTGVSNQFAVCKTTSASAATTQDIWLIPREITGT